MCSSLSSFHMHNIRAMILKMWAIVYYFLPCLYFSPELLPLSSCSSNNNPDLPMWGRPNLHAMRSWKLRRARASLGYDCMGLLTKSAFLTKSNPSFAWGWQCLNFGWGNYNVMHIVCIPLTSKAIPFAMFAPLLHLLHASFIPSKAPVAIEPLNITPQAPLPTSKQTLACTLTLLSCPRLQTWHAHLSTLLSTHAHLPTLPSIWMFPLHPALQPKQDAPYMQKPHSANIMKPDVMSAEEQRSLPFHQKYSYWYHQLPKYPTTTIYCWPPGWH